MNKNYKKKIIKKTYKKMDLFEGLLLNFNFVMIYIIHKMFVLIKNDLNNLNYLKSSIFECLYKVCNKLLIFF